MSFVNGLTALQLLFATSRVLRVRMPLLGDCGERGSGEVVRSSGSIYDSIEDGLWSDSRLCVGCVPLVAD